MHMCTALSREKTISIKKNHSLMSVFYVWIASYIWVSVCEIKVNNILCV